MTEVPSTRDRILWLLGIVIVIFYAIFPVLWIVSLALDPRNISRPTELRLIPPGASFAAFERVLTETMPNNTGCAAATSGRARIASTCSRPTELKKRSETLRSNTR